MKVQPIDCKEELTFAPAKHVAKSRLKRLFERQFLRSSLTEKTICSGEGKDHAEDVVSLDAMIVGYFEEGNHEKSPRGCCHCFHANFDGGSDDDDDDRDPSGSAVHGDAVEAIKVGSVSPSPLLLLLYSFELEQAFDGSSIRVWCSARAWRREISWRMFRGSSRNSKADRRAFLAAGLRSLGYDAATCKSRWDKNPSFPAGEHEYVDVVTIRDRLLVDADFRSEFEVARPSKTYRAVLQHLPQMFVGQPERLQQIVAIASEAARQSLKKKGLHVPPWRRHEYMKTKWFSAYQRASAVEETGAEPAAIEVAISPSNCSGDAEARG